MASKAKRKAKRSPVPNVALPTPERITGHETRREGMATRIVPTIDTLLTRGQIKPEHYEKLLFYRNQALQAQDDECQESTLSPNKVMGGSSSSRPAGGYIPSSLLATPAMLETSRIERDLGSLREITRAIAVEDLSLSQWCISQFGGRERYDGAGNFVAIVPTAEKRVLAMALLDLKNAAGRIVP